MFLIEMIWNFSSDYMMFLNIIVILFIIFFQKRDPVAVYIWALVLLILPITGFILYIFLGRQIYKEKRFKMKGLEDEFHKYVKRGNRRTITNKAMVSNNRIEEFSEIIRYNQNTLKVPYGENNDIEIYFDGVEKFTELAKEIEKAEKYIYFQYYIIRYDEVFKKIEPLLIKKAQEGVRVCILYDGMGCHMTRKSLWKKLNKYGIETVSFFPAILGPLNFRINYRNHRKIVVIDGKVAFTGGFNVGREYVGLDSKFGYWRDTHIKVSGDAVINLELRFIMDWNYAVKDKANSLHLGDRSYSSISKRNVGMQIISSGPDISEPIIRNNFIKMIALAKESIRIQTPYFILDETMMTALKIAIKSGIKVEIMIPNKSDHPLVNSATKYFAGQLIEVGAKCYAYKKGFLHSKVMTIDSELSTIGTANMDIRSFKLNFEVNAIVFDESVTKKINMAFNRDINDSIEITREKYKSRSAVEKIAEKVAVLFSPIM